MYLGHIAQVCPSSLGDSTCASSVSLAPSTKVTTLTVQVAPARIAPALSTATKEGYFRRTRAAERLCARRHCIPCFRDISVSKHTDSLSSLHQLSENLALRQKNPHFFIGKNVFFPSVYHVISFTIRARRAVGDFPSFSKPYAQNIFCFLQAYVYACVCVVCVNIREELFVPTQMS